MRKRSLKKIFIPANIELIIEWKCQAVDLSLSLPIPNGVECDVSFGWEIIDDFDDDIYSRPTLKDLEGAGYDVGPLRKLGRSDESLVYFEDLCTIDTSGFLSKVERYGQELKLSLQQVSDAVRAFQSLDVNYCDANDILPSFAEALSKLGELNANKKKSGAKRKHQ